MGVTKLLVWAIGNDFRSFLFLLSMRNKFDINACRNPAAESEFDMNSIHVVLFSQYEAFDVDTDPSWTNALIQAGADVNSPATVSGRKMYPFECSFWTFSAV